MNRMGESNVANVANEIAQLSARIPRRAVGDACTKEILKALVDGPRASEQYAAALAAFVAGVSGELVSFFFIPVWAIVMTCRVLFAGPRARR